MLKARLSTLLLFVGANMLAMSTSLDCPSGNLVKWVFSVTSKMYNKRQKWVEENLRIVLG
jgi:hypothetical protein